MTSAELLRAIVPVLAAWLVVVALLVGQARSRGGPRSEWRSPRRLVTMAAGGWVVFVAILVVFYRGLGFATWRDVGRGALEGAVLAFLVVPAGFSVIGGLEALIRRLLRR